MRQSIHDFMTFMRRFWSYLRYVSGVLIVLILLMLASGLLFAWWEGRNVGDAIYFAFITGLTVGYGDIAPTTLVGRIISIFIGLTGMIFMGVTVAVATRALADSFQIGSKEPPKKT